jgi:hypothetical protein
MLGSRRVFERYDFVRLWYGYDFMRHNRQLYAIVLVVFGSYFMHEVYPTNNSYTHITNGDEKPDERPQVAFGHEACLSIGCSNQEDHRVSRAK